jgi:histone H3/H4
MTILSADFMATISRDAIKKLVKKRFGAGITESGAEEFAKILEHEASVISAFAVENSKKNKRDKVTRKDIRDYVIKEKI